MRGTPETFNLIGPSHASSNRAEISLSTVSPGSANNSTGRAFKVKSSTGIVVVVVVEVVVAKVGVVEVVVDGEVGGIVVEVGGVVVVVALVVEVVVVALVVEVVVVALVVEVVVVALVVEVVVVAFVVEVVVVGSVVEVVVVGSVVEVVVVGCSTTPDKLPGKDRCITINKEHIPIAINALNLHIFFMANLLRRRKWCQRLVIATK
ncbi:hypothetical protein QUF90_00935 [Desulfococcaceae bacterium HSG9]|nr:hypothetical protein [Desulfococcaceae bacterium HSG9]